MGTREKFSCRCIDSEGKSTGKLLLRTLQRHSQQFQGRAHGYFPSLVHGKLTKRPKHTLVAALRCPTVGCQRWYGEHPISEIVGMCDHCFTEEDKRLAAARVALRQSKSKSEVEGNLDEPAESDEEPGSDIDPDAVAGEIVRDGDESSSEEEEEQEELRDFRHRQDYEETMQTILSHYAKRADVVLSMELGKDLLQTMNKCEYKKGEMTFLRTSKNVHAHVWWFYMEETWAETFLFSGQSFWHCVRQRVICVGYFSTTLSNIQKHSSVSRFCSGILDHFTCYIQEYLQVFRHLFK